MANPGLRLSNSASRLLPSLEYNNYYLGLTIVLDSVLSTLPKKNNNNLSLLEPYGICTITDPTVQRTQVQKLSLGNLPKAPFFTDRKYSLCLQYSSFPSHSPISWLNSHYFSSLVLIVASSSRLLRSPICTMQIDSV